MALTFDQQLNQFERDRLALINQLKKPALLRKVLLVIAVAAFFITFWASFAVGIAWFVIYAIEHSKKQKFSKRFQEEIVPHMFSRMSSELQFDPLEGFTLAQIGKTGMVSAAMEKIESSNRIKGNINGQEFEFSKLIATFTTTNGKGQKNSSQGFTGHAILFSMNEGQDQQYYVFPKAGLWLATWYRLVVGELPVKGFHKKSTKNESFDQNFDFWAKEGMENFPNKLIENLTTLKEKLDQKGKTQIAICKSTDHLFFAINWNVDLFGFTLEKNVTEEVKETLEEIKLCLELPELVLSKL